MVMIYAPLERQHSQLSFDALIVLIGSREEGLHGFRYVRVCKNIYTRAYRCVHICTSVFTCNAYMYTMHMHHCHSRYVRHTNENCLGSDWILLATRPYSLFLCAQSPDEKSCRDRNSQEKILYFTEISINTNWLLFQRRQ